MWDTGACLLLEHGGAAREDNVRVEASPAVDGTFDNGRVHHLQETEMNKYRKNMMRMRMMVMKEADGQQSVDRSTMLPADLWIIID